MKKVILFIITLTFLVFCFVSCGKSEKTQNGETKEQQTKAAESSNPKTDTPEENDDLYKESDYAFVQKFEPPTGDYRQIVKDYMLKMANFEWTPSKTFTVDWKEKGDFSVGLTYEAGKKYKGLVYSQTKGDFYQFEMFVKDGVLKYDGSTYYEEMIGNHCSASMDMAYQQLLNFPYQGSLKPSKSRQGLLEFPGGLETPQKSSWISADVFELNGKEKIFNAYTELKTGDILYKNISGSGHTRMVDYVEISKSITGQINYSNSKVYTIEQTNAFESKKDKDFVKKNGYDTTWWIDHTYSLTELYNNLFMPVTLTIYRTGEPLKDAFICLDQKITPENINQTTDAKLVSNFPFSFAYFKVTDKNGKVVSDKLINDINPPYSEEYQIEIDPTKTNVLSEVQPGTYTFTLTAGIARGRCEICSFEFTK